MEVCKRRNVHIFCHLKVKAGLHLWESKEIQHTTHVLKWSSDKRWRKTTGDCIVMMGSQEKDRWLSLFLCNHMLCYLPMAGTTFYVDLCRTHISELHYRQILVRFDIFRSNFKDHEFWGGLRAYMIQEYHTYHSVS